MYSEYVFVHCHVGKTIFNILYSRAYIPHQADMMLEFDVTANALCTNSAFQFGVTQL